MKYFLILSLLFVLTPTFAGPKCGPGQVSVQEENCMWNCNTPPKTMTGSKDYFAIQM